MDDRFATKAVGEAEAIQGFDVASNTSYFFWCKKESDYVMRIMGTGGFLPQTTLARLFTVELEPTASRSPT
jgi:hypothetical protein